MSDPTMEQAEAADAAAAVQAPQAPPASPSTPPPPPPLAPLAPDSCRFERREAAWIRSTLRGGTPKGPPTGVDGPFMRTRVVAYRGACSAAKRHRLRRARASKTMS
jgi:hypothetical protein